MGFFELVKGFIKAHEGDAALKAAFLDPLKAASKDLQAAAMYFMQAGQKNPTTRWRAPPTSCTCSAMSAWADVGAHGQAPQAACRGDDGRSTRPSSPPAATTRRASCPRPGCTSRASRAAPSR